ncbi:hypothetical protein D3C72_1924110 [compost metagenome]
MAIECSKPRLTKAVMGNRMASKRSVRLWPPIASHTARHTSTLHRMPRAKAAPSVSSVLLRAIPSAVSPTAPPARVALSAHSTSSTVPRQPMTLPR